MGSGILLTESSCRRSGTSVLRIELGGVSRTRRLYSVIERGSEIMLLDLGIPVYAYWLIPLVVWDGVWKGLALWKAGRNAHMVWFICLFLLNTVGILPIIYLSKSRGAN